MDNATEQGTLDDLTDVLRTGVSAETTVPAVLSFADRQMTEQRGWLERMLGLVGMSKGSAARASAVNPDPDHDGDRDYPPGTSMDTDHDSVRGEGHMLKGSMCKGCGFKAHMQKGHPHFGKKRQVAEELLKGHLCPKCGVQGMAPIMAKGDDELPEDLGAPMAKGVSSPELDQMFTRLARSVEFLEALPELVAAQDEIKEMLKGQSDRLDALDLDAAAGAEFREAFIPAMTAQFEQFCDTQEMLKGSFELQQEMLKGLEPKSPTRQAPIDVSPLDAALDAARLSATRQQPMVKGSEGLTEDQWSMAIAQGIVTHGDKALYQRGGNMGNGIGRDIGLVLRKIGAA